MNKTFTHLLQVEFPTGEQHKLLKDLAGRRNWGLALLLVGWLHLLAFSFCYFLAIVRHYHESTGYLMVWIGELAGMWLIFRICGGSRLTDRPPLPLELFIRRV